ncbi:unnamed protein product [Urochloa humidicola]
MAAGGRGAPAPEAVPAGGAAAADEVVRRVRPTEASERRRAEVVDYVRRLVGSALGCEVPAFGSVPLKTYLPDGDIDLTVLGNTSYDSTLVNDVYCILESEEQNSDAEFVVKDLERIDAEVRLIKCTIGNIIVDISFNQTGGICTLCFLELVDRKVGKNNLFKRSIILIKAWCYYESRLLGAHHGLISTYALEVLILYIFNLLHKSLHSPLEVLYRFLEYFSKFDWDNYCISLNGPVALSSLPNLIVEATVTHADDLLFDKEFLKSAVDNAIGPPRNSDACYTRFRPKHLNIIDPLKEYNNLGRSVNRASFNRIRTAFLYGAQKLGQMLMLPPEVIPDQIYSFFKNTLGRNGSGVRPDTASNGTGEALLDDISSMKISYNDEHENTTYYHLSKSSCDKNLYVGTNEPTHLSSSFPRAHSTALSTDSSTRSSNFVHHAPKQYSSFYQGNGHTGSRKCSLNQEVEQESHCTANAFHVDDRPSIQSHVPVNNPSPLNSLAGVNTSELSTEQKNWSDVPVGKHHLPLSPLSLPDLSGDLDSQFRCLRQVQYHLEYLFDGFLQSVQEASSADTVHKDPFQIPAHSILFNRDPGTPRLLLPSCSKSNGTCQQNVPLPSRTNGPSNGLSLSSSYIGSEVSSVSWCYSFEDSAEMSGSGTDVHFSRKSCDTHKEQFPSSREKGKILSDHTVNFESNQSSAPGARFVPHKEQVQVDSRTKEKSVDQALKIKGYIQSDRDIVEMLNCHTRKKFVSHDDEARQVLKCRQDVCLNKKFLQKQYDTSMESTRTPSAMNQMPRQKSFNVQNKTECARASLSKNFPMKQSFGNRKEHELFDRPTKQIPICEPLNLENRQSGWDCSKKISAGKQNYDNHKGHLSFVGGAGDINIQDRSPSNRAINAQTASKAFASPLVFQRSRAATTNSRPPGFCKVGDEDEFPPLSAGIR